MSRQFNLIDLINTGVTAIIAFTGHWILAMTVSVIVGGISLAVTRR